VVTCLFSAIGHVLNIDNLRYTIKQMAAHLNPGGVLIVEPWLSPEVFQSPHFSLDTAETPEFVVARVTHSTSIGRISDLNMHYTIGTAEGVERYVENHELGLFTQDEYERAFERAGLQAIFDPKGLSANGRGAYIGVKPI
jgi:hypothetical protein